MKHLFVICCIIFLTITVENVHSTNSMMNTGTDIGLKLNSKAKLQTKTVTATETSSQAKITSKTEVVSKIKVTTSATNKLENKRTESIMSYFKGLPTRKKSADDKKDIQVKKNRTKIIIKRGNPDIYMEDQNVLNIVKQGWLKVSTPHLKNLNKFPKIVLPDETEHEIPTQNDYFRVNEGYDPVRNPDSAPTPFYFWMRLSFRNLYYSVSKDSINVLGNIPVEDIVTAKVVKDYSREPNCFEVIDNFKKDWILCAETRQERNLWVCKIKSLKNQISEALCLKNIASDEAIVVEKKVTQPIILIPQASPMCNEDFNYEQNGDDWVCDCREGIYKN